VLITLRISTVDMLSFGKVVVVLLGEVDASDRLGMLIVRTKRGKRLGCEEKPGFEERPRRREGPRHEE